MSITDLLSMQIMGFWLDFANEFEIMGFWLDFANEIWNYGVLAPICKWKFRLWGFPNKFSQLWGFAGRDYPLGHRPDHGGPPGALDLSWRATSTTGPNRTSCKEIIAFGNKKQLRGFIAKPQLHMQNTLHGTSKFCEPAGLYCDMGFQSTLIPVYE